MTRAGWPLMFTRGKVVVCAVSAPELQIGANGGPQIASVKIPLAGDGERIDGQRYAPLLMTAPAPLLTSTV